MTNEKLTQLRYKRLAELKAEVNKLAQYAFYHKKSTKAEEAYQAAAIRLSNLEDLLRRTDDDITPGSRPWLDTDVVIQTSPANMAKINGGITHE